MERSDLEDTSVARAAAAVKVLSGEFTASAGNWWTAGSGFWHGANALETFVDYMSRTGDRSYVGVITPARKAFQSFPAPSFYDDEGWWGIALCRAHELTGNSECLNGAVAVFEDMALGWDSVNGGGVWFRRTPKSYPGNEKGAITNELFLVLATLLARLCPSDAPNYAGWATKTWAWLRGSGLIDSSSLIYGSLTASGSVDQTNVPHTYMQGVILEGLAALAAAETGSSRADLLGEAVRLADACISHMTSADGILQEVCEKQGTACSDDAKQFKGIFMRYLRRFRDSLESMGHDAAAVARYEAFLTANANSIWDSYPSPPATFGMAWKRAPSVFHPDQTDWIRGTLQSSAADALVAAIGLGADIAAGGSCDTSS